MKNFNIMDHVMVPKHEILRKEEREEFLKKFRNFFIPEVISLIGLVILFTFIYLI